jgi:hypothetical protein
MVVVGETMDEAGRTSTRREEQQQSVKDMDNAGECGFGDEQSPRQPKSCRMMDGKVDSENRLTRRLRGSELVGRLIGTLARWWVSGAVDKAFVCLFGEVVDKRLTLTG